MALLRYDFLARLGATGVIAVLAACSNTPEGGSLPADAVAADGSAQTDATADGAGGDAAGDTGTDGEDGADAVADAAADADDAEDAAPVEDTVAPVDAAPEVAADVDWGDLLDPPDTAEDAGPVVGGPPVGKLYAHTSEHLYELELQKSAFVLVGKFTFDKKAGLVTDLALDDTGKVYAVTHDDLFTCTADKAACKWLASLPESFNGMTFVPKGTVDPNQDALIAISEDGDWNHVQFGSGTAKIKKLGSYGGGWLSSGDAFSVEGIGTYATLKGKGTSDSLAKIDPKNGKILKVIGATGVKSLFGLAWWSGVFYGFSSDGKAYVLDVQTGKATAVSGIQVPGGVKWWGAGVSTRAAGSPK